MPYDDARQVEGVWCARSVLRGAPWPGHGLVATVTYRGGWGDGSEVKKQFVYLKSTSNFWPL